MKKRDANLKTKNILFLVNNYNSFQKDQIESVSSHFNSISVIVRQNLLLLLGYYLTLGKFKNLSPQYRIDKYKLPPNICIYPAPLIYIPMGPFYKILGTIHFKKTLQIIEHHNIKFDLIHSHFLWSSGYVGAVLSKIYNKPFFVTAHGYDIYKLPFIDLWWKNNILEILNSANVILTPSNSNKKILEDLGFINKTVVVPNGFNSNLFFRKNRESSRDLLGIPADSLVLISVGNLEKIKGHRFLIDAVYKLKNIYPRILCYIIGDGLEKQTLAKQIIKLGLNSNVKLLGALTHKNIPEWLSSANLFVFPSLRESFGVAQLEAMACGLPIVATTNGGSEEIIISDNYGYLCKSSDAKALTNSIMMAIEKKWDSNKIEEYSRCFTWETQSLKLIPFYQNYLSNDE